MRGLTALVLFSLIGCQEQAQRRSATYLNFDSLINDQVVRLVSTGATVEKVATVNGVASTRAVNSREINWKEELRVFGVLGSVNKAVYSGDYEVREIQDDKSNLTVKMWEARTDLPLRSIKIFYLSSPKLLKRLEAKVEQSNFVFNSTKNLTLEFNVFGDIPTPERYGISGSQNFFWAAPQYYSLEGFILVK